MSKVKRQHFVPQSYLKRWAREENKNQIFVFDKERQCSFSSAIKSVASSNYFYDFPAELLEHKEEIHKKAKEDGISIEVVDLLINEQAIEKALSEIEGRANDILERAIKKIDDVSAFPEAYIAHYEIFSDESRDMLAYFIALQFSRTEDIRFSMEEIDEKLYKEWSWLIMQNLDKAQHDKELTDTVGKDRVVDLKKAVDKGQWTKDSYTIKVHPIYTKMQHIGLIFELAEEISKYLISYKWLITRNFSELPYYTSDNPVVKKANLEHSFYSHGFNSKGIEIHFPISPKYALTIFEPSYLEEIHPELMNIHILDASYENVIYCNDIQVQSATSQLFSQVDKFDLALKRVVETPKTAKRKRQRFQIGGF